MSAWLPIASAPKDTAVLVSNGQFINIAKCVSIDKPKTCWCWYLCMDEDVYYGSDYERSSMLDCVGRDDPPTHWRPLPALPRSVQKGSSR